MHPTREGWSKVRYVKSSESVYAVSFQDHDGRLVLHSLRPPDWPLYLQLPGGKWVWPEEVELLTPEEELLVKTCTERLPGPAFYLYSNFVVDSESLGLLDSGHE